MDNRIAQRNNIEIEVRLAGAVKNLARNDAPIEQPLSSQAALDASIVDIGSREIEIDVNETYIHGVKSDQRAEVDLDARPDVWPLRRGRLSAILIGPVD